MAAEKNKHKNKLSKKSMKIDASQILTILESMQDGVYISDGDFNLEYVNGVFIHEFGPLKKIKCYEYFHRRKEKCPWCRREAIEHGEVIRWEWFSSTTKKFYDIIDAPLFRQDGTISKLQIARDITEKKKIEEALLASEAKFRGLVDNALVGVYKTNMQGEILYVNDALISMLGFDTASEMIGEGFSPRYKNQADRERLMQLVKEKRRVNDFEVELVTKQGEVKNVLLSATWEGEEISGMILDISKRKKAELALRESEKHFRILAEESPNMIFINQLGRMVYVNAQSERIMGYKRHEFYATNFDFQRLAAEESLAKVEEAFTRHMEGREVAPYEYTLVTKEGKKINAIITTKLIEYKGKAAILGIVTDITGRKSAEEAQRQLAIQEAIVRTERVKSEELTRAYAELQALQQQLIQSEKLNSIGRLVAGVAHELNSPLTGLLSLLRTYRRRVYERSREFEELQEMIEATKYMAKIVKDLTSFAGETHYNFGLFDVNDMIESTVRLASSHLVQNNVMLEKQFSQTIKQVKGDKNRLQQVVLNMITNACDSMPQGGTLIIHTRETKNGHGVVMEFKDTGIGIAQEFQSRIFDPFFSTKEQAKGMGLGLSVAHGIVKAHKGNIIVDSEPQKGTQFTVFIPYDPFEE